MSLEGVVSRGEGMAIELETVESMDVVIYIAEGECG